MEYVFCMQFIDILKELQLYKFVVCGKCLRMREKIGSSFESFDLIGKCCSIVFEMHSKMSSERAN